mgnify:CR=1 FL=1
MKLTTIVREGRAFDPFAEQPYRSVTDEENALANYVLTVGERLQMIDERLWLLKTPNGDDVVYPTAYYSTTLPAGYVIAVPGVWAILTDSDGKPHPVGLRLVTMRRKLSSLLDDANQRLREIKHEVSEKKYKASQERMATKQAAKSNGFAVGNTIPESQVPQVVDVWSNRINNAYFAGSQDRYAGSADDFPYTGPMKKILANINAALVRNNIPKLHTTYSSLASFVSQEMGSSMIVNFVIIGGGAGPSGGKDSIVIQRLAAGTWYGKNLYISGHKMKLDAFVALPEADQDALLKAEYKP